MPIYFIRNHVIIDLWQGTQQTIEKGKAKMKKTYVMHIEDKMIYKLEKEMRVDGWLDLTLELVCGWDYINADENDEQGYVGKEYFVEEAEFEYLSCDIMNESIMQVLNENGLKVIEKLPKIHG